VHDFGSRGCMSGRSAADVDLLGEAFGKRF
jgi:hypothetical protein